MHQKQNNAREVSALLTLQFNEFQKLKTSIYFTH